MGKYDPLAQHEVRKANTKISLKGKRRDGAQKKRAPVDPKTEKAQQLNLLDRMGRKSAKLELKNNAKATGVAQVAREKQNREKNKEKALADKSKKEQKRKKKRVEK